MNHLCSTLGNIVAIVNSFIPVPFLNAKLVMDHNAGCRKMSLMSLTSDAARACTYS